MKVVATLKKCVKKGIVFIWKVLHKLHIISDCTFRGLMLHFTDEYKFLTISRYFDRKWYVKTYPDVAMNPVQHYMKFGFKEGKNPGPEFDGAAYMEALRDIRELDINPLLDLEMRGLRERRPCPSTTNFWGCHESEGRKYLVFSSILPQIHVYCQGGASKEKQELESQKVHDSAVEFFEKYIYKEFWENTYLYDITELSVKWGTEITVETDLMIPMHILTLFMWSSFSYKRFLEKDQYLVVTGNRILVTDYGSYVSHYDAALNPQQKHYFDQMKQIKAEDKDTILFAEFRDITNDNAWQVFLEAVRQKEKCYFVTGRASYEAVTDPLVKSHMVVYNSEEHIQAFLRCRKIFCSWTLSDIVPTVFKHEFFAYPFVTDNWYYCPHGISYDKNSYFLTPIFLSQPKKLYCCSENEKHYFEEKCGLKNIEVTGYPRMDKWQKANTEDILFDFTYRKQYTDEYFEIISKVVRNVRSRYPDRGIYYLFHPAISRRNQNAIMEMIGDESIVYAHASDQNAFNEWFNKCKYLITDYSSVAYDFAYKENGISIYYLEEGFTENHYELYDEFYEKNCGVIVKSTEELMEVLDKNSNLVDVRERIEKFFSYMDKENTRRVYQDAFVTNK